MRNEYKILVENLQSPRVKWDNNIKMDSTGLRLSIGLFICRVEFFGLFLRQQFVSLNLHGGFFTYDVVG